MPTAPDNAAGEGLFEEITATLTIRLLPKFASDVSAGVKQELNRVLIKAHKQLGGVPLMYYKVTVLDKNGLMFADLPFIHIRVRATFLVFAAREGRKMKGKVNLVNHDSLGILLFNTFNATIPVDNMAGLTFDRKTKHWKGKLHGKTVSIGLGDDVEFHCKGVQVATTTLLVLGTFEKPAKTVTAAGAAGAGGAGDDAPVSGKRRRSSGEAAPSKKGRKSSKA